MRALFLELPPFEKCLSGYLTDDRFRELQLELLRDPERGKVIAGTGGLRKMRFADAQRGKGKRGGLRVIYFWWERGGQFWLFTLYDKDEISDLTAAERKVLKGMLKAELEARQ